MIAGVSATGGDTSDDQQQQVQMQPANGVEQGGQAQGQAVEDQGAAPPQAQGRPDTPKGHPRPSPTGTKSNGTVANKSTYKSAAGDGKFQTMNDLEGAATTSQGSFHSTSNN